MSIWVHAQTNDPEFQLIPEADPDDYKNQVEELTDAQESSGKFFEKYNKFADAELNWFRMSMWLSINY